MRCNTSAGKRLKCPREEFSKHLWAWRALSRGQSRSRVEGSSIAARKVCRVLVKLGRCSKIASSLRVATLAAAMMLLGLEDAVVLYELKSKGCAC